MFSSPNPSLLYRKLFVAQVAFLSSQAGAQTQPCSMTFFPTGEFMPETTQLFPSTSRSTATSLSLWAKCFIQVILYHMHIYEICLSVLANLFLFTIWRGAGEGELVLEKGHTDNHSHEQKKDKKKEDEIFVSGKRYISSRFE